MTMTSWCPVALSIKGLCVTPGPPPTVRTDRVQRERAGPTWFPPSTGAPGEPSAPPSTTNSSTSGPLAVSLLRPEAVRTPHLCAETHKTFQTRPSEGFRVVTSSARFEYMVCCFNADSVCLTVVQELRVTWRTRRPG